MHYFFEEYDTALIQYEKVQSINPQFPTIPLGFLKCYLQTGLNDEARELCYNWLADDPAFRLYHTNSGTKEITLELYLNYLIDYNHNRNYPNWYHIAFLYMKLGEQKKALDALVRAIEGKSTDYLFINVDPVFKDLHSEPRFKALLEEIGL